MDKIRNFCIIAHIDHGKSTLADRLIETTHTVSARNMKQQLLDTMDLERERGITIKLQPITLTWHDYTFNLIDTPGHIDFTYEVSRSLAAVEGALLLIDATQGIQAQTISNLYLAIEQNLVIIPIINKIDMPAADIESCKKQCIELLQCKEEDILTISAKTGEGIDAVLMAIANKVPSPVSNQNKPVQALIFDAAYDEFKGVVVYVRVMAGTILPGKKIIFLATNSEADVIECGYFKPHYVASKELVSGQIGYLITNFKSLQEIKIGDTITTVNTSARALPGYKEIQPMVYAGVYPKNGDAYPKLKKSLDKMRLSDASLKYEPESSDALGFGFRCGFLGLLHLDIFQERLNREAQVPVIITTPTVAYNVTLTNGTEVQITSPTAFPSSDKIVSVFEPYVELDMITPHKYMGALMEYISAAHATMLSTTTLDGERLLMKYNLPLRSVIVDFYDSIKNISSGYASYTYEMRDHKSCDVIKLDIRIAENLVPALSTIVYRSEAQSYAREIVQRLKNNIPRAQFVIKIQASLGSKIIASERLSALRKDVTAGLYGGDVTRKRKLLEKQKKGKKKMMSGGKVDIPSRTYLSILRKN